MKPTQEQILSALNKLVRENKTELKAEKVELGLVDDLKKKITETDKIMQNMDKAQEGFEKAYKKAVKVRDTGEAQIKTQRTLIAEMELALEELGVKQVPKELSKLKNRNEDLKDYVNMMTLMKPN